MSVAALALIGASVLCHATWNLLAKRAAAAGAAFVAVWSLVAAVLWAPLGLTALWHSAADLDAAALVAIGGALVLHSTYYLALQRAYRIGDLSVVYPMARGSGPVLACVAAVLLFGERPGLLGWAGILLLSASVAILGRGGAETGRPRAALWRSAGAGLGVGVLIAAYTVWDRHSVTTAAVAPLLLNWATDTGRAALMLPWLARHRTQAREVWRRHRREALGVAILSPAAYVLILMVLTSAPVTLVAPLREVSVVLVVFLGARLLGERDTWRRLLAALGVVTGAFASAFGR